MLPRLLLSAIALVLLILPAQAAFETRAKSAYVVDLTTGTVLMDKNADTPLPPASMSKLMTLNMLFEALRDGRVTMETQFGVSSKASKMGGSKMFLRDGERVSVENLIQGIIVQSGNDACVVVAEGLAGTEDAFARLMNERARVLGMKGSTFANASGWPNPNHRMSMHDLAFLGQRMIVEFPEYYGYFAQESFTWDGIEQDNRNPLLKLGIGADGLKTGHTNEAGYGLVGSATQGTRRIVFVISGLPSQKARAEEAERIVNWAFRQFTQQTLIEGGKRVAEAPVWMGELERVGLVAKEDVSLLVPAITGDQVTAEVTFQSPIQAPIAAGDEVAEMVINVGDLPPTRIPLVAETDISRGGFLPRLRTATRVLLREVAGATGS